MLSVLISSHNGADTIDQTLAKFAELIEPPGGWQLIIVNNASTDDTASRIKAWSGHLPLEYLEEPRLGKSFAMNTAVRHAKGDLIIMTDDDVLPQQDWLIEWDRVAALYSHCSLFGGSIIPEFGGKAPPHYVPSAFFGLLYGASADRPEGVMQPTREDGFLDISGGNCAFRKAVFDDGHQFSEMFLRGKNGLMGEDTEFAHRLAASGHKACFVPSAAVRHIVHEEQTKWGWIHRRFFRHGRAKHLLMKPVTGAFPWNLLRSSLGSSLRALGAAMRGDKAAVFTQSRGLACDLGALYEALRLLSGRARSQSGACWAICAVASGL